MKKFVVTSFSAVGYRQYARRFLESFDRFVPADVPIIAYLEAPLVDAPARVHGRWLGDTAFASFQAQWGNVALANGREETPAWKTKDRADGYSFRTDAMKFCRKVFALDDAARRTVGEDVRIFWIDADVVVTAPPPAAFFDRVMGDADVIYLGRAGTHSECGFLGFRCPRAINLITSWASFYVDGLWQHEREWHDSYLFDRARQQMTDLRCHDMSPGGRGHVWHSTVLGSFMDHMKGERKTMGYSPERKRG